MIHKERREETPAPLPKINVPPSLHTGIPEENQETEPKLILPAFPDDSLQAAKTWDPRFATILIALVVLVNITLAVLFSGDTAETGATAPPPALSEKATLIIRKPEQGKTQQAPETETFVSPEDKRLLLKELTAAPKPTPLPKPSQPANDDRNKEILSIITKPNP